MKKVNLFLVVLVVNFLYFKTLTSLEYKLDKEFTFTLPGSDEQVEVNITEELRREPYSWVIYKLYRVDDSKRAFESIRLPNIFREALTNSNT